MPVSQFVSVRDFGPTERQTPDVTILTSHAEGRHRTGPFWQAFPDVIDHLDPVDRPHFPQYLDLEYDVGTSPLALKIAARMAAKGRFVRVVRALVHRAVLDCHRMDFLGVDGSRTLALRNIWSADSDHQALFARLAGVHHEVIETILATVRGTGFLLDLHSMWPYSPRPRSATDTAIKSAQEEPGGLAAYIDDFVLAHERGGPQRPIDFVSSSAEGRLLVDPVVRDLLARRFQTAGLLVQNDFPYSLGSKRILGRELAASGIPTVCVDIPKPYLTDRPDDPKRIVRWRDLSANRVGFFANEFSEGVDEALAA